MKNRKRILKFTIVAGLALSLCLGSIGGASGSWATIDVLQNDIKVVVNNRQIYADNFLYNDTTYLPLRAIAEATGININYDGESNTAYVGANNYYAYDEMPWCPNAGVYLGLNQPVVESVYRGLIYNYYGYDEETMKFYTQSDMLQKYLDLFYNLGFRTSKWQFMPAAPDSNQSVTLCNGGYEISIGFMYADNYIYVQVLEPEPNY